MMTLLEFARSQEPAQTYEYFDSQNCAYAQYLKAIGQDFVYVGGDIWRERDSFHAIPENEVTALVSAEHTFGALADRLAASTN